MKSPLRLVAFFVCPLALFIALSGCSGVKITLTSIAVTPANPSIKMGASQQFKATGTYSDNSTQDLTSQATWSSGTMGVATITTGGNATGVAAGTSMITATLNGVSGHTSLTVIGLSSIAVTPANPSVALGLTQQFTATGTYSDNSTQDLTSQVTWAVVNPLNLTVATISTTGLAQSTAVGAATITATLSGVTGQTVLTVTGPVPASIEIVPQNPTIAVGQTEDFTALIVYTDGSTQPPTGPLTWTSGTTATASILSPAGIAVALATGTSKIIVVDAATTFTNNTNLTVVAAVARFAYTPNFNGQSISVYAINSNSGVFTPVSVVHDTSGPYQLIPGPSGKFAYALEATHDQVATYDVDPMTGALLPSGLPPASTGPAGSYPFEGTIDPTGRFLYVANESGGTVAAFSINPSTGALTAIGSPVPVGAAPLAVILDRTAAYLYVVNDGDDTVSGFSVQADGSLVALSTPTYNTGIAPTTPVIDPLNQYLYVPNFGDGTAGSSTVSVFSIGADGNLTEITGSPFTLPSFNAPYQAAIDPSGKYLLVGNSGAAPGTVSVVNLVAGGGLGTEVAGSPFASGVGPTSVTIGPAGKTVAVTNQLDNTLSIFTFNSSTGALTPTFTVETQASPFYTNFSIGTAAPSLSPADVYASNSVSNDISAFTSSSGGALTPAVPPSTSSGLMGNTFAATDLSGKTFYTDSPAATNVQKLASFSIDQSSGALTTPGHLAGSTGDTLGNLYAEPSGQFLYAADLTAMNALIFHANLNPASSPTGFSALTNLNAIVGDPGGTLLYALGTNSITPANIGGTDGSLASGATQSFSGTWTAGAIDPSGHFLVALDSAGNMLHSFQITPVTEAPGSDGVLTDTLKSAATGGTAPTSVAFDPLGRFVFVTDATAKSVTVFAFNSSTGVINATSVGSASLTTAPEAVAVDATGTYLYVSVLGNPTANPAVPGSVSVYTIGSSGTLTAVTGSPFTAGTGTAGIAVTNKIQ